MPVFLLKHQKMSDAKKIYAGSLPAVVMALNIISRNGLPKPWRYRIMFSLKKNRGGSNIMSETENR